MILPRCAGWSAPLLFANPQRQVFLCTTCTLEKSEEEQFDRNTDVDMAEKLLKGMLNYIKKQLPVA